MSAAGHGTQEKMMQIVPGHPGWSELQKDAQKQSIVDTKNRNLLSKTFFLIPVTCHCGLFEGGSHASFKYTNRSRPCDETWDRILSDLSSITSVPSDSYIKMKNSKAYSHSFL